MRGGAVQPGEQAQDGFEGRGHADDAGLDARAMDGLLATLDLGEFVGGFDFEGVELLLLGARDARSRSAIFPITD